MQNVNQRQRHEGAAQENEILSGKQEFERARSTVAAQVGVEQAEDLLDRASEDTVEDEPLVEGTWSRSQADVDSNYDPRWGSDGGERPRRFGETLAQFEERANTVGGGVGTVAETPDERNHAEQRRDTESFHVADAEGSKPTPHNSQTPYYHEPDAYSDIGSFELEESTGGWDSSVSGAEDAVRTVTEIEAAEQRETWTNALEGVMYGAIDGGASNPPEPAFSADDFHSPATVEELTEVGARLAEQYRDEWRKISWPETPDAEFFASLVATRVKIERLKGNSAEPFDVGVQIRKEAEHRAESGRGKPDAPQVIPTVRESSIDRLDDDTVAAVKEQAERVVDRWESTWSARYPIPKDPDVDDVTRFLACRVEGGMSASEAAFALVEDAQERAKQTIIGANPQWMTDSRYDVRVDVEARVTAVFEDPSHPDQAQVFLVEDEYGFKAKVSVWKGHDRARPEDWRKCKVGVDPNVCDPVTEGAKVLLENFAVRSFRGQTQLSSSRRRGRESNIEIIERGHGKPHTGYPNVSGSAEQTLEACSVPSAADGMEHPGDATVRSQSFVEKTGFYQCTSWTYPRSVCPDWFVEEHTDE